MGFLLLGLALEAALQVGNVDPASEQTGFEIEGEGLSLREEQPGDDPITGHYSFR
jgi:hypothetical protein